MREIVCAKLNGLRKGNLVRNLVTKLLKENRL